MIYTFGAEKRKNMPPFKSFIISANCVVRTFGMEGDDPRPGGALKIKRARHGWYTHQTRRSGDDPHAQIIDCRRTSSREHRAPAQREPRTPRTDDSHTTEILATYRPLPRPSGFCHAGQLPRAAEGRPLTERALLFGVNMALLFGVNMALLSRLPSSVSV